MQGDQEIDLEEKLPFNFEQSKYNKKSPTIKIAGRTKNQR